MIKYYERQKAFLIRGKSYDYVMRVNRAGFLQNLHYGAQIDEGDISELVRRGDLLCPPEDVNGDLALDNMPNEYGFFARGDFREPAALIARQDGARMSRFRYRAHKFEKGAPELKGLPHARSADDTLIITLCDDFSCAEIKLYYVAFNNCDALVRFAELKNAGSEPMRLDRAFSFCTDLPSGDYKLLRLFGAWGTEFRVESASIGRGVTRLQSLRGVSSYGLNPFAAIMRDDCTETRGECYGVQLVYSGNWALTAEKNFEGSVRLQGGVNDFGFSWELGAGEVFLTPQAALCYSGEGLGRLSREYADFIRERILRPDFAYSHRPIVANNWEATYFDFDAEKLFPIIDGAAELGADTFVLDDGWFGARNSDGAGLGDWVVNEKKLSGGLKTLIERCKKKGLKFGLWFEPEMVNEDSELYRARPEWAIAKAGVEPVRGRNQLVLDFTREEVVNYVFDSVSKILSENDISYVKWDFNRDLTEFYSANILAHRQGEFAHRFILGAYSLMERITSAFPQVFFEGCAGGGRRFDAGMLYYFPQIWTSDDSDGFERTRIQWGASLCYPVSAMSCHVSACPNHQTGRVTPLGTRCAVASAGATGCELDCSKLSEEEKAEIKKHIANYKGIEELVLRGDLYRLGNPFEENMFCEMLVSKDKKKAYVVGEVFLGGPFGGGAKVLRLCGLSEGKTYEIEELGITASGKTLAAVGVPVPQKGDFGAWTWRINECEKSARKKD